MRALRIVAAAFAALALMAADTADTTRAIEAATRPMAMADGRLSGPGADFLMREAKDSQFVIVAENHNDRALPQFVSALFSGLHSTAGYQYVAIEQDPFGMEAASVKPARGDLDRIVEVANRYPFQFTFQTDQELRMIADVGRVSTGRWRPVWGFDQTFGSVMLLEELKRLAPDARASAAVDPLLAEARAAEAWTADPAAGGKVRSFKTGGFSRRALAWEPKLQELRAAYRPKPGSRADDLLSAMQKSAEIYGYYSRAEAGEPVGLYNNWVREDWMKQRFMRDYREAEKLDRRAPRVIVKAGGYHLMRGRGLGNVFTLGNFLHEFAIANGGRALSLNVVPLGTWADTFDKLPPEYQVLLPSKDMTAFTVVDLRPLRPYDHRGDTFGLTGADRTKFSRLVFSYDMLVFTPSGQATWALTGPAAY